MLLKVFCRYTLIQVLQKAKATFSRKEREQDGIFQSLIFHLVSNKPFLKGRRTDIPGLGSQSVLLLEVLALCSHMPGLSHLALRSFQRWKRWNSMSPVMTALPQTAHGSQQNVPALNLLMWLHRDAGRRNIILFLQREGWREKQRIQPVCGTPGFPISPHYQPDPA